MPVAFRLDLVGGRSAVGMHLREEAQLPEGLAELGLAPPRPVVVVVGGAAGLSGAARDRLRRVFRTGVLPVLERFGAAGVDGGTRAGIMQVFGEARAAASSGFPLVGVVSDGVVQPDEEPRVTHPPKPLLEEHHTHFVLVPGTRWGDEAPWIARVATALSGGHGSVTVLVNGGDIAYTDAEWSVAAGRPILTLAGSGRAADELAAAQAGRPAADPRASALVGSGLVSAVPVNDPTALGVALTEILGERQRR